jgi:hypothetical protein
MERSDGEDSCVHARGREVGFCDTPAKVLTKPLGCTAVHKFQFAKLRARLRGAVVMRMWGGVGVPTVFEGVVRCGRYGVVKSGTPARAGAVVAVVVCGA